MKPPIGALLALCLGGCEHPGLLLGHHVYLVVGVGAVRVDRADKAVGISSRVLGLTSNKACGITVGLQATYCTALPADGDVAVLERGSGSNQHLVHLNLRKGK